MDSADPAALIEFLAPYPVAVQELTLAARLTMLEMLWPVTEIWWDATQAVCSGFTYTESTNDNFVNLAIYANHVTLIFPWGIEHRDPEARLKGEGKRIRHLRLAGIETLHDPYVIDLIRQAQAIAKRPAKELEPAVIVKVMKGPKRRPKAI